MENKENKMKINKEVKRHKSAIIPPGPILLNNSSLKDYSDSGINNTNSTTCDGLFRLKSNSLFAYQEFDKFSFFVIMNQTMKKYLVVKIIKKI